MTAQSGSNSTTATTAKKNGYGLQITGICMAKNEYTPQGGQTRYTVDIAVPGNRHNLAVNCEAIDFAAVHEMGEVDWPIAVASVKGNLFFHKVRS